MKNKHEPALLRTSYLSNEIIKRTPKSHETIPLKLRYGMGIFPYEIVLWDLPFNKKLWAQNSDLKF
jgi:hypothetical protein